MSFTPEQKQEIEKVIIEILEKRPQPFLHQSMFVPDVVKREAIEDRVVVFGETADRPTDDSSGISAYFSTDDNIFSLYDGSEWVEFARIPASPQVYAASNVTTDRTYNADLTTVDELGDILGTLI